ncbi:hypothetical protein MRS44_012501 [Fusarium solani]|uniref:uncharacterized protein n=1 Tax=Fusarium solani TaxID=169388 RepID=UPI0032C47D2F|nr:hypothetical protein MRS44_012501 [Fusarium solani]
MSGREPAARRSVDITQQQSWSEASQADDRPATPDLEGQPKRETPGWIRLAQEQQLDPRHMIAPRCTAIAWSCLRYRLRRMLRVWKEIQQQSLAGEDVEELLGQLAEEQDQYQRLLLQTSRVLGIDQPNKYFLKHLLPSWKTLLGHEDDAMFADEMNGDWVSLSQPQKLDQAIGLIPMSRIGRWVFRPFLAGKEKIGKTTMYNYYESCIRAVIFAGFSCLIGVFACAPVAIQSLNVKSVEGEVATYLVFMIVFAWLVQALLRGDEKILLTCLAYAALMATVMRQGQ